MATAGAVRNKLTGSQRNLITYSLILKGINLPVTLTAVILALLHAAKKKTFQESKPIKIAFIIFTILAIILAIVSLALEIYVIQKGDMSPSVKKTLTTSVVFNVLGLVAFVAIPIIILGFIRVKGKGFI